jgi:hypothetical protein
MTRSLITAALLAGMVHPLAAQHLRIGPELVVADYSEVSRPLSYRGIGPGAAATLRYRRLSLEGAAASIRMNPREDGSAAESFTSLQIDGWLRFDATGYLTLEAGATHRSTDSEFAAQSLGAVRVGAQTRYPLGPGAAIWLRGNYLAGARFSGGGSAPLAVEVGLGLDITLGRHLSGSAIYAFQRLDRKTNPGGGAETPAPIEQSLARVGIAVNW